MIQSAVHSLVLIATAEMGDKSQLLVLALASQYSVATVLLGLSFGVAVNHGLAVWLGGLLATFVPKVAVELAVAASFIGFGAWTLRGESFGLERERRYGSQILTVAMACFLVEMGDKTQLMTAALAAREGQMLAVWAGSSVGMLIADSLAVVAGVVANRRLPERLIRLLSGWMFVALGLMFAWSALVRSWFEVLNPT